MEAVDLLKGWIQGYKEENETLSMGLDPLVLLCGVLDNLLDNIQADSR